MAASLKMDELLVSWLGSDNVYENVLSLIEKHREEGAAKKSPPSSPGRKGDNSPTDDEGGDEKKTEEPDASKKSRRAVIPPFYVEPKVRSDGSVGSGGVGRQFRFKGGLVANANAGGGFEEDQTWDGTPAEKGGEGGDEKDATDTAAEKKSQEADDAIRASRSPTKEGDSAMELTPTGDGDGDAADAAARVPVKEQVRLIYAELGSDPAAADADPPTEEEDAAGEEKEDRQYLTIENFVRVTKEVCNFPTFFNRPLYGRILELWNSREGKAKNADGDADDKEADKDKLAGEDAAAGTSDGATHISYAMFRWYYLREMEGFDASERFFRLLKDPSREYIVRDDFLPYVKELLSDHPGLEFLSNHAEFQEKYAVTVITRIFYSVNRCHDGRITLRQVRRSDLLSAFQQVDEEEDINKVTRYFSYEHFYVLYCRFWELDHDRDYRVTREDLLKYGDHCLSHLIVDRIFDAAPRPFEGVPPTTEGEGGAAGQGEPPAEGAVAPGSPGEGGGEGADGAKRPVNREYLSYEDFIFFMLSEEDKANEVSVRYWFSSVDVDGDGMLNNMEMRSFYAVQLHRMQCMGHEIVPFEDMLCQMIDMIKPKASDHFVVEDFLRPECAQVSGALFDALFNLNKYLQFEQRDPFMERQKREDEFETDWDRFACIDYNRLAMEEEAREEEAMEIDWVTVDDEDDDGEDFNSLGLGGASEAPF